MTTGLFVGVGGATHEMKIALWDSDDTEAAVWRCSIGDEHRFVEGYTWQDVWEIVELACRAYEED